MNRWLHITFRAVTLALLIMMVIDGALLLKRRSNQREWIRGKHSSELVLRVDNDRAVFGPPNGYTVSGKPVSFGSTKDKFLIVRFAQKGCPYCVGDKEWRKLAAVSQPAAYRILVLTPSSQGVIPKSELLPAETEQESFVSMAWIRRFRLDVTPTLLVFSPHGHLVWSCTGALKPGDAEQILHAVGDASRSGL